MIVKTLTKSFAGGEIAPELRGRLDLDKYQTALDECTNWVPLAHGPIRTRQGSRYVRHARDPSSMCRLIQFQWSLDQTMVLELGHQYISFATGGQSVMRGEMQMAGVTAAGSVVIETIPDHELENGDLVYISGMEFTNGLPADFINNRFFYAQSVATKTFVLVDLNGEVYNASEYVTNVQLKNGVGYVNPVYKIASPYLAEDLREIRYTQNSDVITLTHDGYPTYELKRIGAAEWTLTSTVFKPTIEPPTTTAVTTQTLEASMTNTYVVTSVSDNDEESLPSQHAVKKTYNATSYQKGTGVTKFVCSTAVGTDVFAGGMITVRKVEDGAPGSDARIAYEAMEGKTFEITAVKTTTPYEITIDADLSAMGSSSAITDNIELDYHTAGTNLKLDGGKNTITWDAVDGAAYYNVYKATVAGGVYGFIGRTTGTKFVDNYITPSQSRTVGSVSSSFDTAGNYPRCCTYYEQRRVLAGTINNPQTVWMTKTGTESNLLSSVPSQANDAIRFRMAARDHNAIMHVVPMNDLIVLTAAGEWRAFAPSGEGLSAETLEIRPQTFTGCSEVTPALTSGSMVYVQFGGYSLRELAYSWEAQTYKSTDLTAMCPHLFELRSVVDMAFQRTPIPVLWAVMSDGDLLSCTYMPEHKVVAFARHTTDGAYESVCVAAEDGEDRVYFSVRRTDKNGNEFRTIEQAASMRPVATAADNFQLDCGLTLDSATPVSRLTGLWHLEGKQVSILTDGAVHPKKTVTNGEVELDYEALKIHAGLGYRCRAKSLPIAFEVTDGGASNVKNVNEVTIRVKNTTGLKIGTSDDDLIDTTRITGEFDAPPVLYTGVLQEALHPDWNQDGAIVMVVDDPLPAMVMSVAYTVAVDA